MADTSEAKIPEEICEDHVNQSANKAEADLEKTQENVEKPQDVSVNSEAVEISEEDITKMIDNELELELDSDVKEPAENEINEEDIVEVPESESPTDSSAPSQPPTKPANAQKQPIPQYVHQSVLTLSNIFCN